jgi:hypothetical protein
VGVRPVTHTVCLFVWLIGWLVVCLIITLCSTQCYVEKGYLQDTALTGWHTHTIQNTRLKTKEICRYPSPYITVSFSDNYLIAHVRS